MNANAQTAIAPTSRAVSSLVEEFMRRFPEEAARELETVPSQEALALLEKAPTAQAASVLRFVDADCVAQWLEDMDTALAVRLLVELDPPHAAFLLSRLPVDLQKRRLQELPASVERELCELMEYPQYSAGQLMDTQMTIFRGQDTVAEALERIRRQPERTVASVCLTDAEGKLTAVLPLQAVAVAQPNTRLETLVTAPPVHIQALAPRDEVVELLEKSKLSSLPVINFSGKLLGIISHDALVEAAQQAATQGMQAMVGAGRGEGALSKASFAIRKRLPWLQINLVTAFMASAVVGLFEDTIAQITALAVFLPVVAGQSGNTGAQALAVTMRGLALREFRVSQWPRVTIKEVVVGFVNGCAVAATTATAVYLWTSSTDMALVIGIAMVFSMMMAGLSGAIIPVILTALRQDPAQSASIVLTTVTDIVGFMSFLGLATLLLIR